MADKKISEMTAMVAAQIANDDDIVISDTSAQHTKRAPISELATFFGVNTEGIQDTVAAMFTGGTMTGLSATYDDPNGVMNFSLAGGVTTAEIGHLNGVTSDIQTQLDLKSPLASPTFTGNPVAPTQAANNSSTRIATTEYVQSEIIGVASDTMAFTNKSGNISQWTNDSSYITSSSTSTLTNKSGSISQWTNNSGYITGSSTDTLTNKTISGSDNTISNLTYSAISGFVDEDISSVSGSHNTVASAKATKTYVDAQISGIDTIAEAGDTDITSASAGQILVHDGSNSFDNKTASVTLTGAVTGTANMNSTGAVSVATTIPNNTVTINGQAVALGGSATIPSVLQSGGTFTGELHLNDNVKLSLGGASGSGDLEIFHDTADSVIKDGGTGALEIRATDFRLNNSANSKNMIKAYDGDRVELFYDNNKRVETSNAGITVTGGISLTGTVDGRDVATDGTKLDGISSGAEVNVQANWTESSNTSDAFIQNKPSLSTVATSGSYNDLSNKPTIPTNNNQLSNGAGYITSVSGNISQLTNNSGYVTSSGVTSVATGNGLSGGTITSTGTLTMSGSYSGTFQATGNLSAYASDERLKNFKGKIENALDKVDRLSGYYYEWNDTAKGIDADVFKDGVEVGVNAQEVEEIMPEVVTNAPIVDIHNLDTDYKTVYYDKLVPLLIESVKELKNRNEKLELIVNRLITEVEEK